jgi:hypothetical protein
MFQWVVVPGEARDLLGRAVSTAWRGGAAIVAPFAWTAKRASKPIAVAWPDAGVSARRTPRWPELLADWSDIHEEKLFPGDACPVLAEDVSGLGVDAVAIHGAPGLKGATVAWYARGAMISYEHVGQSTVSWEPDAGLGRPYDGSTASLLAMGGRKLADAVGSVGDAALMDRIENTNRAIGEVLIERALRRMLDADPPAPAELAGLLVRAPQVRYPASPK